jgi:hypothetical protein
MPLVVQVEERLYPLSFSLLPQGLYEVSAAEIEKYPNIIPIFAVGKQSKMFLWIF